MSTLVQSVATDKVRAYVHENADQFAVWFKLTAPAMNCINRNCPNAPDSYVMTFAIQPVQTGPRVGLVVEEISKECSKLSLNTGEITTALTSIKRLAQAETTKGNEAVRQFEQRVMLNLRKTHADRLWKAMQVYALKFYSGSLGLEVEERDGKKSVARLVVREASQNGIIARDNSRKLIHKHSIPLAHRDSLTETIKPEVIALYDAIAKLKRLENGAQEELTSIDFANLYRYGSVRMIASADKFKQAQVEAASGRLASGAELTQTDRDIIAQFGSEAQHKQLKALTAVKKTA